MRQGIAVAGNIIVDVLKQISEFPERHGLVGIDWVERSLGGSVFNVSTALACLRPDLPIPIVGIAGQDGEGDYALSQISKYPNIDISRVLRMGTTSFTDVLIEARTKVRTFLTYGGANRMFGPQHIDLDNLPVKILHMAYILLLETMDSPDPEYGTLMARVLAAARARGILTSVDVVSEVGGRHKTLMPPSLRHADIACINEIEAGQTTGIPLREGEGALLRDNIPRALQAMMDMGVHKWAVIHAPEGGFAMDAQRKYTKVPGLLLPPDFIKGTVGAGDAFCAGLLSAAHDGLPLEKALEDAVGAAASSLSTTGSTSGVYPLERARELYRQMPKQKME